MDSTTPVCKAPGLPICDPHSTTSTVEESPYEEPRRVIEEPGRTLLCDCIEKLDSVEGEDEEEEEEVPPEPGTFDEELQFEQIKAELLEQKKRVDLIDQRLSLNMSDCADVDPCTNLKIELNSDKVHPEILELQRHNHQLRQQLIQLQHSCKAADWSLKHLRKALCRDLEAGVAMQHRLNELDSFKQQVEHEQGLCRQRYRHLQEDKYEWLDCANYLSKRANEGKKELHSNVFRIDYLESKGEAIQFLNEAKIEALKTYDYLSSNMAKFAQMVDPTIPTDLFAEGRFGTDIAAFVHRHKHLRQKETH